MKVRTEFYVRDKTNTGKVGARSTSEKDNIYKPTET